MDGPARGSCGQSSRAVSGEPTNRRSLLRRDFVPRGPISCQSATRRYDRAGRQPESIAPHPAATPDDQQGVAKSAQKALTPIERAVWWLHSELKWKFKGVALESALTVFQA